MKHYDLIRKSLDKPRYADTTGWFNRHTRAWYDAGWGRAIACMIEGAAQYADHYRARFDGGPLSSDYVLGPAWADSLRAVRTLLNGETGGLDCGTVDALICEMLALEGFDNE